MIADDIRRKHVLLAFMGGAAGNGGYSLFDRFTADTAAGSVNGTTADTGQTRTVTDTNSKLSVAGGVASFATGGVGTGDPGLWYPAITTVNGTVLVGTVNFTSGGGNFGFDTAATGAIQHAFRLSSTAIGVLANAVTIALVSLMTDGVAYSYALVQGSAGYRYFVKGGSQYTNWTLVWVSVIGAPGSLLPGAGATNTTSVFTADNIRVPIATYVPMPICFDSFTR